MTYIYNIYPGPETFHSPQRNTAKEYFVVVCVFSKVFSCVVPLYSKCTRALTFFFSRMSGRPLPPCRSPSAGSWVFSQFSLL